MGEEKCSYPADKETERSCPAEELMDIVDYNGLPTGRTHVRGRQIDSANKDYFRAVVVCFINSEGKMLIQQRHTNKRSWPGLWDVSCGGAVTAGEEPQISGMREVKEELGLTIDLHEQRPALITTFRDGFTYTFIETRDVNLDEVVIQKEEVLQVGYASKEEILQMMKDGTFVGYRPAWIEYVFSYAEQQFMF